MDGNEIASVTIGQHRQVDRRTDLVLGLDRAVEELAEERGVSTSPRVRGG
jgi:hypothetical protein